MEQEQEFNLELSEPVLAMIEEISERASCSAEQVVEYVIREFLMHQLTVIKKRSEETDTAMGDLVNMQFARLVEFLHLHPDQFRLQQ